MCCSPLNPTQCLGTAKVANVVTDLPIFPHHPPFLCTSAWLLTNGPATPYLSVLWSWSIFILPPSASSPPVHFSDFNIGITSSRKSSLISAIHAAGINVSLEQLSTNDWWELVYKYPSSLVLRWNNAEVYGLHRFPGFPRDIKLQSPAAVTGFLPCFPSQRPYRSILGSCHK